VGNAINAFSINTIEFNLNSFTEQYGLIYSWYCQYKQSEISGPDGYSTGKVSEILGRYSDGTEADTNTLPDNIIVIMNETFADYSLIADVNFNNDPLENIHKMADGSDNLIEGKLAVSVYGGYTANTEFEFLTGSSLLYLPASSIPYIQYVNHNMTSLCFDLRNNAYNSTAVHLYYSAEYRRRYVYGFLGFENTLFGDDISESALSYAENTNITNGTLQYAKFSSDADYVRGFASDAYDYSQLLNIINSDEKNFIFNVTIQNHGGYTYAEDDFIEGDFVKKDTPENQYLTCTSLSDKAFSDLTDQLSELPQKTAVIMFGDHQPYLEDIENYVSYTTDDLQNRYIVPYILWTNYDVDWDINEITSPNYLSAVIKKDLGLPLTEWDLMRLDAYEQYPVLTTNFIIDSNGNYITQAELGDSDILTDYSYVMYSNIFE
jgi:hypothetical protein